MFAGYRPLQIDDSSQGISFPGIVLYPTETPSRQVSFTPYTMEVSQDAPRAIGQFPLVLISHGNGGHPLLYRTIGLHLARHGYVVAMIEHHGNSRNNNSLKGTTQNLIDRPRHVRLAIDAIAADSGLRDGVRSDCVAVIGHSLGGYTALAVAGGEPSTESGRKIEATADPRVKALVLLSPATAWYRGEPALRSVSVPILLLIAENDPHTPRWHADIVLNGVPDRTQVNFRVIENAGHFTFLSPFPAILKNAHFAPSVDPDGFDREIFHNEFPDEIRQWLDDKLKNS